MDENKVLQKLIEHDERFDRLKQTLADKASFSTFNEKMDKAIVILQRLDQERIFTQEWVRRVEAEVERHTQEINKVKQQLNIV